MEITRKEINGLRHYVKDGVAYPSVTTVLKLLPKGGLIFWAISQTLKYISKYKYITPEISKKAYSIHKTVLAQLAQEGTDAHENIEAYLVEGKANKEDSFINRFKAFEKEYNFVLEKVEYTLHDKELGSAGTADIIGSYYGNPIILDLKTSKEIRLSHKVQAVAYKDMYERELRKQGIETEYEAGILLIPRVRKLKWEVLIIPKEEEDLYRKIYKCLRYLFAYLRKAGEDLS